MLLPDLRGRRPGNGMGSVDATPRLFGCRCRVLFRDGVIGDVLMACFRLLCCETTRQRGGRIHLPGRSTPSRKFSTPSDNIGILWKAFYYIQPPLTELENPYIPLGHAIILVRNGTCPSNRYSTAFRASKCKGFQLCCRPPTGSYSIFIGLKNEWPSYTRQNSLIPIARLPSRPTSAIACRYKPPNASLCMTL